jgi:hypothetical protein
MNRTSAVGFGAVAGALVMACSQFDELVTQAPPVPTITTLTLGAQTVEADGVSRTPVRAHVANPGPSQVVVFATSSGSFDRAGGKDSSVSVSLDQSNDAVAMLRAPDQPALAIVTARVEGGVLRDTIRFVAPPGVSTLTVAPKTALADGQTLITVSAVASPGITRLQVTFTTSDGTFLQATPGPSITVDADADGRASALLRTSITVGTVVVGATANGKTIRDTVFFTRAFPDRIDVEPSVFELKATAGNTIQLDAFLRRATGSVSLGTLADFSATRSNGTAIGIFGAPQPSDQTGKVTVKFTPGDSSFRGPISLVAKVTTPNGIIQGSTMITVVP